MNPHTTSVLYDTKTKMYHGSIKDNINDIIIYTAAPNTNSNLLQEDLKKFWDRYTVNLAEVQENPQPKKCCGR